jgi:ABC-type phosphate transport system auxiliary subunit
VKLLDPYPTAVTESSGSLGERATIKQRLTRQKSELEARLKQVNDAIDAMNSQPEVAELLELVMRAM